MEAAECYDVYVDESVPETVRYKEECPSTLRMSEEMVQALCNEIER